MRTGGICPAGLLALLVVGAGGACVNRGQHVAQSLTDGSGESGGAPGAGGLSASTGGTPGTGGVVTGAGGAPEGTGGATPGAGGAISGTGGATSGVGGATSGTGGATSGTGGATSGIDGSASGADADGATSRTDAGVLACMPGVSPASGLLTSFSPPTWDSALGQWGAAGNLTGAIRSYGGGKSLNGTTTLILPPTVNTTAANPALSVRGNVVAADYGGIAMPFDQCVNTTAYSGVRFTLGGTTAGCDLILQLETYSQRPVANGGGCVGTCFRFPQMKIQIGTGPVTVTFAGLAGSGLPATAAAMSAELIGLQFQLQSPAPVGGGVQPSCLGINMTLDDVQLVAN